MSNTQKRFMIENTKHTSEDRIRKVLNKPGYIEQVIEDFVKTYNLPANTKFNPHLIRKDLESGNIIYRLSKVNKKLSYTDKLILHMTYFATLDVLMKSKEIKYIDSNTHTPYQTVKHIKYHSPRISSYATINIDKFFKHIDYNLMEHFFHKLDKGIGEQLLIWAFRYEHVDFSNTKLDSYFDSLPLKKLCLDIYMSDWDDNLLTSTFNKIPNAITKYYEGCDLYGDERFKNVAINYPPTKWYNDFIKSKFAHMWIMRSDKTLLVGVIGPDSFMKHCVKVLKEKLSTNRFYITNKDIKYSWDNKNAILFSNMRFQHSLPEDRCEALLPVNMILKQLVRFNYLNYTKEGLYLPKVKYSILHNNFKLIIKHYWYLYHNLLRFYEATDNYSVVRLELLERLHGSMILTLAKKYNANVDKIMKIKYLRYFNKAEYYSADLSKLKGNYSVNNPMLYIEDMDRNCKNLLYAHKETIGKHGKRKWKK